MTNSIEAVVQRLTSVQREEGESSFLEHLEQVVLRGEAERLVRRLDQIASGEFEILDVIELAAVIQCFAYREFDQDRYHHITRDNMDYVVLLVLAVAAGLCDAGEIQAFAASHDNSISSLTELIHQRALLRRGHEEVEGILDVIKAVYYNTLAGDQTPCKEFRRYECRATASRMRGEKGRGRVFLNREVVDVIRFLRQRGAHVLAVSDRPVEAALIEEEDGTKEDLMSIPMKVVGFSIYDSLHHIE
jgi:hypothetical protein